MACCAIKTGCPLIGVCLPSLGIMAGARRLAMKSSACLRIVAKPFSFDLLIAKIEALLRRTYDFNIGTSITYKDYLLNLGDSSLSYKDKRIVLTSNEQKILKCLFEHKGNVVSREKLMNVLWDTDCYIDDNTLTVNINRLRKKCFELSNEDFIKTRVKQGYIVE